MNQAQYRECVADLRGKIHITAYAQHVCDKFYILTLLIKQTVNIDGSLSLNYVLPFLKKKFMYIILL